MSKHHNDKTASGSDLSESAGSDTDRLNELLMLGDIYTASGFPLTSRGDIDLHLAYQRPMTAVDPDEPYPCW